MNQKRCMTEFKTEGESGTFECYVSVFGNLDSYDDRVARSAFAADLIERGNVRPLLWQHDTTEPIGSITLREDSYGLRGHGKLVLDVQRAREAYALLKARAISGMSIGYTTITSRTLKDGSREIQKCILYECSIVSIGANDKALVDTVKADADLLLLREFTERLRAESASSDLTHMIRELRSARHHNTPATGLSRILSEARSLARKR